MLLGKLGVLHLVWVHHDHLLEVHWDHHHLMLVGHLLLVNWHLVAVEVWWYNHPLYVCHIWRQKLTTWMFAMGQ